MIDTYSSLDNTILHAFAASWQLGQHDHTCIPLVPYINIPDKRTPTECSVNSRDPSPLWHRTCTAFRRAGYPQFAVPRDNSVHAQTLGSSFEQPNEYEKKRPMHYVSAHTTDLRCGGGVGEGLLKEIQKIDNSSANRLPDSSQITKRG